MIRFNGVKIFSATMSRDRDVLGERVTEWLNSHPEVHPVDIVVTQSSDNSFHLTSLTVFYIDASLGRDGRRTGGAR